MKRLLLLSTLFALLGGAAPVRAQTNNHGEGFTHTDTLRGSIGPYRAWWDVTHYDISVKPDFAGKSIQGTTFIAFRATSAGQRMQIDLQQPLTIRSMTFSTPSGAADVFWKREGNVAWVDLPASMAAGSIGTLAIQYGGIPREAVNPPWDGGWIWKTDEKGNPWMSLACQGLGASVWYPCKDTQSDEPDSASLHITVPDSLQAVGNGRLRSTVKNADGTTTWNWAVVSPINNYDIVPSIGKYAHWHEVYPGVDGPLDLDYWVLAYNEAQAREHFKQVPLMLKCFEDWFGPYPWYKDGYKLVETGHLGMEHQSAIAYGNHFKNGYLGRDLSHTGVGLGWDFIIVHESAHEWWGNNLTDQDVADMWIHESFANYAENLYEECLAGKAKGAEYVTGTRKNIRNDEPILGTFGVNHEGSGDVYYKGGNMLHTIRQVIDDDEKWRGILRGLQHTFWHQVVTGAQVRQYISDHAGIDLSRVFVQYLETTKVPTLEYRVGHDTLTYHWADVVPGFAMPVRVTLADSTYAWIHPTEAWQSVPVHLGTSAFRVDENFYVLARDLNAPPPAAKDSATGKP